MMWAELRIGVESYKVSTFNNNKYLLLINISIVTLSWLWRGNHFGERSPFVSPTISCLRILASIYLATPQAQLRPCSGCTGLHTLFWHFKALFRPVSLWNSKRVLWGQVCVCYLGYLSPVLGSLHISLSCLSVWEDHSHRNTVTSTSCRRALCPAWA